MRKKLKVKSQKVKELNRRDAADAEKIADKLPPVLTVVSHKVLSCADGVHLIMTMHEGKSLEFVLPEKMPIRVANDIEYSWHLAVAGILQDRTGKVLSEGVGQAARLPQTGNRAHCPTKNDGGIK